MDDSPTTTGATVPVEFYLPATFQFRRTPGRIERFLGRTFGWHEGTGGPAVGTGSREFYLPGTPAVGPARSR